MSVLSKFTTQYYLFLLPINSLYAYWRMYWWSKWIGKCVTVVSCKLLNETQIQKTEAAILTYLLKIVLVVQLDWQGCHCEIVCYLSFILKYLLIYITISSPQSDLSRSYSNKIYITIIYSFAMILLPMFYLYIL